jgi:hypothetical protein
MAWPGEDDWGEFAWLEGATIHWKHGLLGGRVAHHQGLSLKLRMNDFPEEPMWTLSVDGKTVVHFNNTPPGWDGLY